jgi:hypothetical protein
MTSTITLKLKMSIMLLVILFLTCENFKIKKFTCQKSNFLKYINYLAQKCLSHPTTPSPWFWAYKEVHPVESPWQLTYVK